MDDILHALKTVATCLHRMQDTQKEMLTAMDEIYDYVSKHNGGQGQYTKHPGGVIKGWSNHFKEGGEIQC